ncbi:hypothetical protein AGDE_04821 [Angomonas deanei]|nr:hypothetical protein AGDE_04821 [Angomonas deanei]|eukprot:EPY39108.1 hypothetical protein AGDE_04821 [Angomonas deanei]
MRRDNAEGHPPQFGFEYEDDEEETHFLSAEDLFIRFLDYLKESILDSACSLSVESPEKTIFLTVVTPRHALSSLGSDDGADGASSCTQWVLDAVSASKLSDVTENVSLLFSDTAALMSYDLVGLHSGKRFLLSPTCLSASPMVEKANVLVVDWGCQGLSLCLRHVSGGALITHQEGGSPVYLFASSSGHTGNNSFSKFKMIGGDGLDVFLSQKVMAQFVIKQRKLFSGVANKFDQLQRFVNSGTLMSDQTELSSIKEVLSENIPSRMLRKMYTTMEQNKVAINTQAGTVAVGVEAFYEGVDLVDNTSLGRNKFDSFFRSDREMLSSIERILDEFFDQWSESLCPLDKKVIDYVVISGGMFQIPIITQIFKDCLTKAEGKRKDFIAPDVTFAEPALLNGISSDELFSVGGCLHAFFLAQLARLPTTAPLKGKFATREREEALSNFFKCVESSEEQTLQRFALFDTALFLFVGDPASFHNGQLQSDSEDLFPLFSQHVALPHRKWIKVPKEEGGDLLFNPVVRDTRSEQFRVRPVQSGGLSLHCCRPATTDMLFVCFTLEEQQSDETFVGRLTIQVFEAAADTPPPVVTPNLVLAKATCEIS